MSVLLSVVLCVQLKVVLFVHLTVVFSALHCKSAFKKFSQNPELKVNLYVSHKVYSTQTCFIFDYKDSHRPSPSHLKGLGLGPFKPTDKMRLLRFAAFFAFAAACRGGYFK